MQKLLDVEDPRRELDNFKSNISDINQKLEHFLSGSEDVDSKIETSQMNTQHCAQQDGWIHQDS